MNRKIFSENYSKNTGSPQKGEPVKNAAKKIEYSADENLKLKGEIFASEIERGFISDFEETDEHVKKGLCETADKMVHVTTFLTLGGYVYMTYYANSSNGAEDPKFQSARLVYAPVNDVENKTFLTVQSVGETLDNLPVNCVYDTIMAKVSDEELMVLWTAKIGDNYYRLYRPFNVKTKTFGDIGVNKLRVKNIENDFSFSGIQNAFTESGIGYKTMYSDVGIMQKFTSRIENGERYYYSGAYSGDFNFIIKSKDFITWEYVAAPDFANFSKWENATFLKDDKIYYFVRQQDGESCGFLTAYDLKEKKFCDPVLIEDCQSRSDFIEYGGELYLFHAPVDREHIGVVKINRADIKNSVPVFIAKMRTSCFYPFINYYMGGGLAMSYTVERKHVRLAKFDFNKILNL